MDGSQAGHQVSIDLPTEFGADASLAMLDIVCAAIPGTSLPVRVRSTVTYEAYDPDYYHREYTPLP